MVFQKHVTIKTIFLLYLYLPLTYNRQERQWNTWKHEKNSHYINRRMILLMMHINKGSIERVKHLNKIRFMYEETPFYEMGFIMGEIIERYKKMITHVRRRLEWESEAFYGMMRRVQIVQYIYLEIYNLQRMMHEIELKYKHEEEFANIHVEVDLSELRENEKRRKDKAKRLYIQKKRELKKQQKKQQKARKKKVKVEGQWQKYEVPVRQKGMWPFEYGWDIGTDWLTLTNPYNL